MKIFDINTSVIAPSRVRDAGKREIQGFAHYYAGLKSHSNLTPKNALFLIQNSLNQVIFDQISSPKLCLAQKMNLCGKKCGSNMTIFEKNGKITIGTQVHFFEICTS